MLVDEASWQIILPIADKISCLSHQGSDDDVCESESCKAGTCTLMGSRGKEMMEPLETRNLEDKKLKAKHLT